MGLFIKVMKIVLEKEKPKIWFFEKYEILKAAGIKRA